MPILIYDPGRGDHCVAEIAIVHSTTGLLDIKNLHDLYHGKFLTH